MNIIETALAGVLLVEPGRHADSRGYFMETWRDDLYRERVSNGLPFVQDNHSHSLQGVLRGLHCQWRRPQGKLVRCVRGEIFDVAVDIDPQSGTFGQWVSAVLNEDNGRQLYIPPGYAHGFQVVSAWADVAYKCTDYYDPDGESGLVWNDPEVAIRWPLPDPVVSDRDQALPRLADLAAQRPQG